MPCTGRVSESLRFLKPGPPSPWTRSRVTAEVGDATSLAELARGRPVAGIYSCFGLQQMPKPAETLRGWAELLAPGGALAVTYWPHIVEAAGPWRCLTDLTVGAADWQAGIPQVALRARGVQLVSDSLPAFDMVWPSADAFFEVRGRGLWPGVRGRGQGMLPGGDGGGLLAGNPPHIKLLLQL